MTILRLILGDQLSCNISSLSDCDKVRDHVLMVEIKSEATYAPHHIKRIAFNFSCQRHFAAELREAGYPITYVAMDDPANTQNFTGEVTRYCEANGITEIIVTEPGEQRVLDIIRSWPEALDVTVELRPDDRFLCSHAEFRNGRKTSSSCGWNISTARCGASIKFCCSRMASLRVGAGIMMRKTAKA